MATGKGCDLEAVFRAAFHIDPSTDIATLMEAAIQVVSSTRPKEFSDRMARTLKGVDAIRRFRAEAAEDQKKKQNPNESDQGAARPRLKLVIKRSHSDKNNAIKIREDDRKKNNRPDKSDDPCSAKGGVDGEKELNLKFERSKRKFQQEMDEIRKKKRKIQVLDIKDLPRAPPTLRNKGRVRARALAYVH